MGRHLHLGLGAFHRAHQAVYSQRAGAEVWSVAPSSRHVVDALRAAGHRYTLLVREDGGTEAETITSITRTLHAPTEREQVVAALADPETAAITLTVTEKAYRPGSPVIELLAEGLGKRGGAPVAVISCDNLVGNGSRLAALLPGHEGAAFPATVVDRIVPAATAADLSRDPAAVVAEPYSSWIIQDDLPAGTPAWERGGAVLAADVTPYELAKLRILNGVHSTLAYAGALTGHEHIHAALADPALQALAVRLAEDDVLPTLTPPPGVDLHDYTRQVLDRMRNTALEHRCAQVASDGSQKLPIRLLGTVRDRLAAGALPRWACLAVALWLHHTGGGRDDLGRPVPISDPLAGRTPEELLNAPEVFGQDLPHERAFTDQVRADLRELARHGAAALIRRETL